MFSPGHDVEARIAGSMGALAIFPLPDVVLLPGAMMPLHVFEQRYRDLAAGAIAGTGIIAMAMLVPGDPEPEGGRPSVFPHIGVGEIVAHEKLDSGRYNMLLRGVGRARIVSEHPPATSYRIVAAELIPDVIRSPEVITANARTLIAMCDRLSTVLPTGGERLRALARVEKNPSMLVDMLGAALVADTQLRRELLEDPDVARRYDRVVSEVATLISQLTPSSSPAN